MMTRASTVPDVLFLYVLLGLVWLAVCVAVAVQAGPTRERRLAVLLALLAPFWPLAALAVYVFALLGIPRPPKG